MNTSRLERVIENMKRAGLEQILVSAPHSVYYLTGLFIYPGERMLALLVKSNGETRLFANRLLRKGWRLVISGSNARLLSSELATHLTGRHVTTELFPFSFSEYRRWLKRGKPEVTSELAEARRDYERYFLRGGMPETFGMMDARGYLRNIYEAILFHDILKRHNLRSPTTPPPISTSGPAPTRSRRNSSHFPSKGQNHEAFPIPPCLSAYFLLEYGKINKY